MHNVLSIDATCEPALAVLVAVEGKSVRVIAREEVHFPPIPPRIEGTSDGITPENPAESGLQRGSPLKEVVSRYRDLTTTSVLIVPPADYISINLNLPFSDPRTLGRVLPMEVQDLVPFEVAEFTMHPRRLNPAGSEGQNLIHVGLMPRAHIAHLLEVCRSSGLEPMVFCTPSSCLGAGAHFAPALCKSPGSTLLIHRGQCFCSLLMIRNGVPSADRSIDLRSLPEDNREEILYRQVLLTALSMAQDLGQPLEHACLIGSGFQPARLASALPVPLETAGPGDILEGISEPELLPMLAAAFAAPLDCPPALCDFRTGEFSYRLQFGEMITGLRRLSGWLILLAVSLAAVLGSVYWARDRELSVLRQAISRQVLEIAPNLEFVPGTELSALAGETEAISKQLSELGSDSRLTPLRVLSELSQHLAVTKESGIFLKSVSIKGTRIRLDGDAPDYAALDRIETNLKRAKLKNYKSGKHKKIFCEVKRSDSTASFSGANRAFSYNLKVCEGETGGADEDE